MDEIVAVTAFRDYILVFTKRGKVYRIVHDDFTGVLVEELSYEFALNR